ncbi:hypothetical protein DICSQDRAFT_142995 [Dichomitus squalens LYAD-421 SS1]|uniref:Uncharacterized protein n=1 Tax=Dichomitus squalens TaxID=114155 RepID=A0A4Q9PF39_9APHY|nr:uncharacterized protein DICSQDRAFT_142995 [Dichomitus squalens LYAD-421 SS1]EJF67479.1 hypothetical protein DICSQDRAFT_142995 [Dichomitus squalens LYAD-421 SS1]TBU53574.1 hypothetical protein BD310DRAFT_138977 [Dichomitus squalens]
MSPPPRGFDDPSEVKSLSGSAPPDGGHPSLEEARSKVRDITADHTSSASSVSVPPLRFIDMRALRRKRGSATLRHDDVITSSTTQDEPSPSKRKRTHVSPQVLVPEPVKSEVESVLAVRFPVSNIVRPSCVTAKKEPNESIGTADGNNVVRQLSTPDGKQGAQKMRQGSAVDFYTSDGMIQLSDTDEKYDVWSADLPMKLEDVQSATAPSATQNTLELQRSPAHHTSPLPPPPPPPSPGAHPDSLSVMQLATAYSHPAPTWTVEKMREECPSPASEAEVDELMDDDAVVIEAASQPACTSGSGQDRTPVIDPIARPAAAILRALGPPTGAYAYDRDTQATQTPTLPPEPEASPSEDIVHVEEHTDRQPQGIHQTQVADDATHDDEQPPLVPRPIAHAEEAAPPADPVVGFLQEIGLSPSFADALRRIGISDDERIRAVGALKGPSMIRIEKSLEEAQFDLVARVLIREGLKQRSARGGK